NDSEVEMDPDAMEQDFGKYKGDEGDLKCFINRFIPGATFKEGKVCMITKTPDKHFIIDTHPDFDHVFIAGGFSGHGFKYSSVIVDILSQLVVDGSTPHDISYFSMKRSSCNERLVKYRGKVLCILVLQRFQCVEPIIIKTLVN